MPVCELGRRHDGVTLFGILLTPVCFHIIGSFEFGKPGFPLSDVPLQGSAADMEAGHYRAKPGARWMTGSTLRMDGGEVKSI
jgi:hypothetical protein